MCNTIWTEVNNLGSKYYKVDELERLVSNGVDIFHCRDKETKTNLLDMFSTYTTCTQNFNQRSAALNYLSELITIDHPIYEQFLSIMNPQR